MEILTGNELLSGAVVYLDGEGHWGEDLQKARVFAKDDAEARDAAIAATQATGMVISIEAEAVSVEDGVIVPNRIRERIRAEGPTTPRFSRQNLDEDGHVSI
ncbi:DUF2849 domain-containing protein [Pelagibacterium xiamenense]|uniref:DUF2849 domain-containing protein n=1 Tax=Pelagibacterium xiamenense TaxID=2901140 RepID=UPI001E360A08|nr:DUF2849 domain-containing protein [Pelagibacterium xiamenense]MCD7060048.1 DUF2849 domain-containing protein [Pelagibacterium xiamenense]